MSHEPSRRSSRLQADTVDDFDETAGASDLALCLINGQCPRCGKASLHRWHSRQSHSVVPVMAHLICTVLCCSPSVSCSLPFSLKWPDLCMHTFACRHVMWHRTQNSISGISCNCIRPSSVIAEYSPDRLHGHIVTCDPGTKQTAQGCYLVVLRLCNQGQAVPTSCCVSHTQQS